LADTGTELVFDLEMIPVLQERKAGPGNPDSNGSRCRPGISYILHKTQDGKSLVQGNRQGDSRSDPRSSAHFSDASERRCPRPSNWITGGRVVHATAAALACEFL